MITALLHSQAVKHFLMGGLGGVITAAHIDYAAFTTWNSFKDALAYNWGIAVWRWFKGFVIGGVSTGVLGSFLG